MRYSGLTGILVASVLLTAAIPGSARAAVPDCPRPLVERQRYGFVASMQNWPQELDFGYLKAGWVVDFAYKTYSTPPQGIDRALVIRIGDGYQVDTAELGPLIDSNPGVIWLVGNEPDSIYQDDVSPEEYARIYHDLYSFIKSQDQSSQVAAGSIVQPSPLRLQYLDRILAAYQSRYGQSMPVDVWNIHNAILDEVRGAAGADIPPGIDASVGVRRDPQDNDNMTIFVDQIWAFRQWMAVRGYTGYPLIVTEFGILMPELWYGFDAERVGAFMAATFSFLDSATDTALGDPADGNRLVQRWAWFSLNEPPFAPPDYEGFNGNLFDPVTKMITAHGEHYASHTSSFPPLAYTDLGFGGWKVLPAPDLASPTQTVSRTIQAKIVNLGTVDAGSFTVSLEYDGPVNGRLDQPMGGLARNSSEWLTFTLADLPPGSYSVSVSIDSRSELSESRECNNQATTMILAPTASTYLPVTFSRSSGGVALGAGAQAESQPMSVQATRTTGGTSGPLDSQLPTSGIYPVANVQKARTADITPRFLEFGVPTPGSYPGQIALDAQGRVWISARDANQLARFDPQTEVWQEYDIPTVNSQPWGLALDGVGNVWFAETAANQIGKLEISSGLMSEYAVPTANSQPWDVAIGGGNVVWFTEKQGNKIGKLAASTGAITEYPVPTAGSEPAGIAVYGGDVWFAESAGNKLSRFRSFTNSMLEFVIPTPNSKPHDLVMTSGGTPWLTEMEGNKIAAFKASTLSLFIETAVPTAQSQPFGIAMEGNVAVWFTERAANKLGRYDARQLVFEYSLPTPNSSPTAVVVDANVCAWYTAPGANRIGRLCPPLNRSLYLPIAFKDAP
jgi:streptogramin lyase